MASISASAGVAAARASHASVSDACGSRSTETTRRPAHSASTPRCSARVVLPTPPFVFANARMSIRLSVLQRPRGTFVRRFNGTTIWSAEARGGHGPGDPDRRRVLPRGRLRPRPLPRSRAAPARPDAGARGQRGADRRDRRRVPRPRHGPGPARLLPAPLRPPVPAFAGGPPHHLRPAGGQPVGGQARALATARRDGGTRSRGDARRQHAGAGLPLRPRAPLPQPPRPERVRARPRGAPDLLRPPAAPAHRLAGGDHG